MKVGHRAKLYPQSRHVHGLSQTFGAARFVFNQYINWRQWEYDHGYSDPGSRRTKNDIRSVLTSANKTGRPWLKDVSSVALQEAVDQADKAYQQMVANRSRGKKASLPRRRKHGQQSFCLTRSGFKLRLVNKKKWVYYLYVPKVGWIKTRAGRDLSTASSVTIILETTGQYYACFTLDKENLPPAPSQIAGIDVGLTHYATIVTSNGTKEIIDNPRYYTRALRQLKKYQRALSRTKKGSNNRNKARIRVAKAHKHVAHQRRDFLHKLSTKLASDNQVVCLETLGFQDLTRSDLARNILDASWAMFTGQLDYKTAIRGGTTAYAPAYAPTTRTCSICYSQREPLALNQRTWICHACGAHLDRDANAAINIIDAAGHSESINAWGGMVRLDLARAHSNEPGTTLTAF